ncbi:MAG: hypothetical protein Q7U35_05150 [Methanobacteriaceae archaeon]|nr:hypothetical protein [Methanobacteriaceae archaeon]MDP2835602.1 hypothetical protein [Methanobacteriaceae archaeon]MDP3033799.1 hypothetical protein [Methanobacteriaceae archaeon]MDP3484587.1 hypothetical protein [Methanobacteriaceae archaeon]MDP3624499.1 hypothetical protein [Methanobacteriaceae archaeon]
MSKFMDNQGNISIEYMLIVGMAFIITLMIVNFINTEQELGNALGAARSGASEGINMNNFAIYPKEAFKTYEIEKPTILSPSSIKIVKIEAMNQGFNTNYEKTKIQLKIFVSCTKQLKNEEKDSLGDRINYNVRKSISICFKTENLTNSIYNPAFSPKYVFTTADIKWM